jgi:hypothetical protein
MGTDTPYISMPGDRFVELLQQMGARVNGDKLSDEQFSPIHDFLLSRPSAKYCLELVGFLRDILRVGGYQAQGFHVTGAADFVRMNRSGALSERPADSGLVEFAYWSGETDGDAWCLDFEYNCIRCIPVGLCSEPLTEVRARSYGVFYYTHWYVSFLRAVAEDQQWITKA